IELVTPHNVSNMKISVWDPDDNKFDVFESEMFYDPEYGRYFEVPFGTAKEGGHKFEFSAVVDQNFNMLIRIEEGAKCLHDKMESQEADNLILFKVTRFGDDMHIEHDIELETDKMYKFYIGRVSAISVKESNEVWVDYNILASDDVEFEIYSDKLMEDIDGVNSFYFGTAVKGVYTIKITIRCDVDWVNIGYAIIDDYEISDAVDVDETEEEDSEESEDDLEDLFDKSSSLPFEWMVGTLIFVTLVVGSMTVILIRHRKKNAVSLRLKGK
ncbi:MAG: hypothetical protein ACFFAN_15885, partial [Promethearchaeota archaeon]